MQILKKERFFPNNFFDIMHKKIDGFPEHIHDHFELEFVVEGNGICTVDGVAHVYDKNTLSLLSPMHVHSLSASNIELFSILFGSADIILPVWDYRIPLFVKLSDHDAAFVYQLLDEMLSVYKQNQTYAKLLFNCVLEKIVHIGGVPNNAASSPINNAVIYLLENFRKEITLEKTAKLFGLSACYLSDLFAKQIGMNFKEYLDSLRFSYACSLLNTSDLPVKEVCVESGFSDYANFTRRFKQKYNTTPREYRRTKHAE